jgi:hypothetical protein
VKRPMSRWALGALGGALVACAGVMPFIANTRDQIKAPHARHAKAEVECLTCHETIFDSTTLETKDLPKQKKCFECHKDEKNKCGFCHTQPDKPLTYVERERNVKMNHAEHLERVKEDCTVCHKKLPEPFVTEEIKPAMATCNGCHEHDAQFTQADCKACHKDLSRYPLKPLLAFNHQPNYVKNHRWDARSGGGENCAQCHEQTFCSECHAKTVSHPIEVLAAERTDRTFIHRADFESRHSVEARLDSSTCQRCHGQTFCTSCHTERGLTPASDTATNPHPAGFADAVGSAVFHGKAARRDIMSCAACHEQGAASNCVSCHKVGGIGGTPHPPSWVARHPREEIARNAMCQICHL